MRGENNASVDYQLLLIGVSMSFSTKKSPVCVFTDKLTGALPVLSPEVRGVPLPKVAAHVTGVVSSTEPPTADGEDPDTTSSVWSQLRLERRPGKHVLK